MFLISSFRFPSLPIQTSKLSPLPYILSPHPWMFDRSFQAEPYTASGAAALPGGCAGAPHSGAATADMAAFRLDGRRPRPPNARSQSRHAVARYRRRIAPPLNLIAQLPTRYIPRNPMNIGSSLLDIGYSIALSRFIRVEASGSPQSLSWAPPPVISCNMRLHICPAPGYIVSCSVKAPAAPHCAGSTAARLLRQADKG